jgi:aspartyl protease family protein
LKVRIMRQIMLGAALLLGFGGYFASSIDKTTLKASQAPAAMVATPAPQVSAGGRTVVIPRDGRGHFQVDARIDGKQLGFMVDTGASVIALTATDARRLGLHPMQREFTAEVKTANGIVHAAPAQLDRVEIDGVSVRDVAALIMPDEALSENLLGLSFLSKLRRFEYSNGKLVLEQ